MRLLNVIVKHCVTFCIIEEPVSNILHDLQWILKVMTYELDVTMSHILKKMGANKHSHGLSSLFYESVERHESKNVTT